MAQLKLEQNYVSTDPTKKLLALEVFKSET